MEITTDRALAKIVAEQFEDYLRAETLYWPVTGVDLPALTIGAWLECEWRLKALAPAAAELAAAQSAVRSMRAQAGELYTAKAGREFKSRLGTWSMYLEDVISRKRQSEAVGGPARSQSNYEAQVHHRFKLALLRADVPQAKAQLDQLDGLDLSLKTQFVPGRFVWDPALQAAAPKEAFWFLWGYV